LRTIAYVREGLARALHERVCVRFPSPRGGLGREVLALLKRSFAGFALQANRSGMLHARLRTICDTFGSEGLEVGVAQALRGPRASLVQVMFRSCLVRSLCRPCLATLFYIIHGGMSGRTRPPLVRCGRGSPQRVPERQQQPPPCTSACLALG
jgi:hypothetical protein